MRLFNSTGVYTFLWLLVVAQSFGQVSYTNTLNGTIEHYTVISKELKVVLNGYDGKSSTSFDTVVVATDGSFQLRYPATYKGMGGIQIVGTQGEIPVVLLGDNQTEQKLTLTNGGVVFSEGSPNAKYHAYKQKGDGHKSQLDLLLKLSKFYDSTSVFGRGLTAELKNTRQANDGLIREIGALSNDVGYFLRLQESLATLNTLLSSNTPPPVDELKAAQAYFERVVNLNDERLWHTGFVHRLVYSYYSLSSVLEGGVQHASDFLASSLANSPYKNTYIEEIIGVIQAQPTIAEYFSQKMLEANQQCDDIKGNDMPSKIKRQLEQYSLLKVGNTAPDELLQNGKHISELPAAYKLIVFWASWCEHCQKEIPELRAMYADLKKQDVEVVAMGMDDNAQIHQIVSQANPWVSHFVGRDWNAPTTQRYHVFGTPTYFLVDKNRKIVARPKSVSEVAQWLNRNKM